MPFSESAGVITQSNEAGISISSVASTTDGITITTGVAHGYSDGDFIEISGTTDYNGAFIISNASGSTFDITNQLKIDNTDLSFTSTQT